MVQVHGDEQEQEAGQARRTSEAGRRDFDHPRGDGRRFWEIPLHGQQLRRRRKR